MIKGAINKAHKPKKPIQKSIVRVKYFFKDNRRRDIYDNYAPKFLLDPLVREGIIVDDCWQCCKVELDADVDKNNPRTEIDIRSVENEDNKNADAKKRAGNRAEEKRKTAQNG